MPNNWIVITTINKPTESVRQFARIADQGWSVLVVGDMKTPRDWACEGVKFLSVDEQAALYPSLGNLIPYNHYCRKNLGYLYAMAGGADLILDTDDDNSPSDDFGTGLAERLSGQILRGPGWVNVYRHYSDHGFVWPRGLPLTSIHDAGEIVPGIQTRECPIQQFLADLDPDVDAIFRLMFRDSITFARRESPLILAPGTYSPFNSQNTVFFRAALPLLYLPCYVSFRMTDIWRSFVAQLVLSRKGYSVAFQSATVKQERNAHNLMKDFADEVVGYINNDAIMKMLASIIEAENAMASTVDLGRRLWLALIECGHIDEREQEVMESW